MTPDDSSITSGAFQNQVVSESTDAAVFDAAESIGWKGTPRDVLGKP